PPAPTTSADWSTRAPSSWSIRDRSGIPSESSQPTHCSAIWPSSAWPPSPGVISDPPAAHYAEGVDSHRPKLTARERLERDLEIGARFRRPAVAWVIAIAALVLANLQGGLVRQNNSRQLVTMHWIIALAATVVYLAVGVFAVRSTTQQVLRTLPNRIG